MINSSELADLIARHATEGPCQTAIPNLDLYRASRTTSSIQAIDDPNWNAPALCVIAQGRKHMLIGGQDSLYTPGTYFIAAIDLPILSVVLETDEDRPFLGVRLRLDPEVLSTLLLAMPAETAEPAAGVTPMCRLGHTAASRAHSAHNAHSALSSALQDCVIRLLRLLQDPHDIAMLAPQIEREICYRLLRGPQRHLLRQIARSDSHFYQIKRAIDWLRDHYAERLHVHALAAMARMSVSSFHEHFKTVTSMSPLQFQKQIRLLQARRLIWSGHADSASAGFKVGYESPSQFSREYKRLFGEPPLRDAARIGRAPAPQRRAA